MPEDTSGQHERIFEQINSSGTVEEAIGTLQDANGIAYVTYHLAQTIGGRFDAPFVRTTYPDAWVSRYLLRGYVHLDPVIREGFSRRLPFDWREISADMEARDFLADAAAFGVGPSGYSIPISDRANRRAILSINSELVDQAWDRFVASSQAAWAEFAQLVHQKAIFELYGESDPVPALSPREIECLYWTALGKDQKDIALILGLSEHTVRDYLKSARLKLGCATLSAAATRATQLRIIDPWPRKSPHIDGTI